MVTVVQPLPFVRVPPSSTAAQIQAAMTLHAATKRPLWLHPGSYTLATRLNVPSNLTLIAHGATFSTTDTNLNNPVLFLDGVSNVRISGLTIDGNKSSFAGATENKHGISIVGCDNVVIDGVKAVNCKGDSLYIGTGGALVHNTNIEVRRFVSRDAHRNACSIIDLSHARFSSCDFSETAGTAPESGIDVEPNADTDVIDDVEFYGCRFNDNAGNGINVSMRATPSTRQGGVRFFGGSADDNGAYGVQFFNASDITLSKTSLSRNALMGANLYQSAQTEIIFDHVTVAENGQHGIGATGNADATCDRLQIIGGTYKDNSQASPGAYDGIRLTNLVRDFLITGVTATGGDQGFGIKVGTPALRGRVIGNDLTGNATATGASFLGGDTGHIVEHNEGYSPASLSTDAFRLQGWVADSSQNPSLGTLPASSFVTKTYVQVTEAFNSDGTDTLTIGFDADTDAFAGSIDVSTTGLKTVTPNGIDGWSPSARTVKAYYTNGGSEPTTGKAIIVLVYVLIDAEIS